MADTYRIGGKVGTTIYRNAESQPVSFVVNMPEPEARALAARIVVLLNAESSPVAVEGEKETLWRCNDQDFGLSKITTNRQLAVDGAELYGAILQSSIDGGKTWIDADVQASEEERS